MHGTTGPIGNREIRLPAAWRVWKPQASDTVGSTSRVRHRLGLLPYANDVDATFGSPMRLLDETGFWAGG